MALTTKHPKVALTCITNRGQRNRTDVHSTGFQFKHLCSHFQNFYGGLLVLCDLPVNPQPINHRIWTHNLSLPVQCQQSTFLTFRVRLTSRVSEADLQGLLSDPVLSILPCRSHKCGKRDVQARKQNKLIVPGCKNIQYCVWCKRNAFSKQRVGVRQQQQKWDIYWPKKERSAWSLSYWFHIWFPWQ